LPEPKIVGAPIVGGNYPAQCTCPKCGETIVTRVEKKTGSLTCQVCVIIAAFGGICGCCLIPFCIDGCKVSIIFN